MCLGVCVGMSVRAFERESVCVCLRDPVGRRVLTCDMCTISSHLMCGMVGLPYPGHLFHLEVLCLKDYKERDTF